MSQIALVYTLDSDLLKHLDQLFARHEHTVSWETLQNQATEVEPKCSWSGYVVIVLLKYLAEKNIRLPIGLGSAGCQALQQAGSGILLCVHKTDASSILEQISGLMPSLDELQQYYEGFNNEHSAETGVAMQDGLEFLKRGLRQLQERDECLVLWVG